MTAWKVVSPMEIKRISVIGLGKLGLSLAAVLADRGFKVIGVDVDERRVSSVNRGLSPIFEPGVGLLIRSNRDSLSATMDHDRAVRETDATFVVVPTPSNASGEFSIEFVKSASKMVGKALSKKRGYHLVVVTSTVMPGAMERVVRPTIEKASGKKCGRDFGLCYNPEFIALGEVVKGLLSPDLILIGESDRAAGDVLTWIQRQVCAISTPIERMNFVNAEVAKIAINSYVTMKMSFANTLAEICERLPKGDVDKVTKALGRDTRIGPAYLRGAIGYGGPCFPRDNVAFARFARKLGVNAELARATDRINKRQVRRIVALVERHATPNSSKIGILGVAYKPNTNVTEASQSLELARVLARRGYEVHVYDPALAHTQVQIPNVESEIEALECVAKSDICVIATPWGSFAGIDKAAFKDKLVLDCWRLLDGGDDVIPRYLPLGRDMVSRVVPPSRIPRTRLAPLSRSVNAKRLSRSRPSA
jgi:UDPglucose 6-dehydrogenase